MAEKCEGCPCPPDWEHKPFCPVYGMKPVPVQSEESRLRAALAEQTARAERAERERDEARRLAAEGRKAGRAEAAAILMRHSAEWLVDSANLGGLAEAYQIAGTDDYGARWVPARVLAFFDADGSERVAALLATEAGATEAFCACGRRMSECDGSRKACATEEVSHD